MKIPNKYLQYIIGIPLIALTIFVGYSYDNAKVERIKSNCTLTLGELIDVNEGGEAFDVSAEYQYSVNNTKHVRTVEISVNDKHNFEGWWRDKDWSNQYIWVIYSNEDHSESLVNLSRIFTPKDTANLIKPDNYKGFY